MPSALFLAYFCSFTAISILFMSPLPRLSAIQNDTPGGPLQETAMLKRTTIITGIFSGLLLVASSLTVPASASELSIRVHSNLFDLLLDDTASPSVQNVDYWGNGSGGYTNSGYGGYYDRSIRRFSRHLRRRGLYPVSEYRVRKSRIIVRAEDRRGTRYKVVGNARNGRIIGMRRIGGRIQWEPRPSYGSGGYGSYNDYGDYRRPGFVEPRFNDYRYYKKKKLRRKIRKHPRKRVRKHHPDRPVIIYNDPRKYPYIDENAERYEMRMYGSNK